MPNYILDNGDDRRTVEVVSDDGTDAHVVVGETSLHLETGVSPDGCLRVVCDGVTRRFRTFQQGDRLVLAEGPYQFGATVRDERALWLLGADGEGGAGSGKIKASMPGRVVKVEVAVGDTVEAGSVVAVLEAMKMENDVKTPVGGEVVQIEVTAGEAVETGQLLVALRPSD